MADDYDVLEIKIDDKQIEVWIERLKQLRDESEHVHLEYDKGEILVHNK